ncbi:MAG: hypothetical protein HWD61_07135 [Parachlamydiaceae bacterium]|nr:MAG: hypothetical protein HWD61_07135 [Parachlamydiaceae bacterium]
MLKLKSALKPEEPLNAANQNNNNQSNQMDLQKHAEPQGHFFIFPNEILVKIFLFFKRSYFEVFRAKSVFQ